MKQLGSLQLRIMKEFWATPHNMPVLVQDVVDTLNTDPEQPKLAYTTVGTVMRTLAKNGFLRTETRPSMRQHLFFEEVDESAYIGNQLENLIDEFFDGDQDELCFFVHTNRLGSNH